MTDNQRRYRIQTVSELTGVATSTLRAWERRYGVPRPARTDSKYRMYDEGDLALIRQMRALIDSGMSASDAARAARSRDAQATDGEASGTGFESVVERLYTLACNMDADDLARTARAALALGDAHAVVLGVYVPVLRRVGDAWHEGVLTVAHEHLATEVIGGIVRDLLRQVQPAYPRARAIIGCFADEQHTLPMYIAGFALARAGVATQMLGARTDPKALRAAVRHLQPQIVGLSVTSPPSEEGLDELLDGYADAVGRLPWLVGGAGAQTIAPEVEARGGIVAAREGDALRSAVEAALVQAAGGFAQAAMES